jgi:exosortase
MTSTRNNALIALTALCAAALFWSFWPVLAEMVERWSTNPQYSHGYLVPLFSAFLLWYRRRLLPTGDMQGSWWCVPVLAVGLGLHLAGAYLFFDWFSAAALIPVLAGIVLAIGGVRMLAWSWPAIAFLAFMLPLPHRAETLLSHPLQRMATIASTYVFQTIGMPAVAEGNIILLEEMRVGVVEACNGLGMLVTFFALSTAVAIVVDRPLVDKLVIVASAIPIALAANVLRIVMTGLAGVAFGPQVVEVFHDFAGWIMTPLALGMLGIELWVLSRLLVEVPEEAPVFSFGAVNPSNGTTSTSIANSNPTNGIPTNGNTSNGNPSNGIPSNGKAPSGNGKKEAKQECPVSR